MTTTTTTTTTTRRLTLSYLDLCISTRFWIGLYVFDFCVCVCVCVCVRERERERETQRLTLQDCQWCSGWWSGRGLQWNRTVCTQQDTKERRLLVNAGNVKPLSTQHAFESSQWHISALWRFMQGHCQWLACIVLKLLNGVPSDSWPQYKECYILAAYELAGTWSVLRHNVLTLITIRTCLECWRKWRQWQISSRGKSLHNIAITLQLTS